ncbi:MAG: hypothetical protein K8S87_11480 [Planctomycetes bacterium]|nr:hypothetical protein [Planctomycetota bacterium]
MSLSETASKVSEVVKVLETTMLRIALEIIAFDYAAFENLRQRFFNYSNGRVIG